MRNYLWVSCSNNIGIGEVLGKAKHEAGERFVAVEGSTVSAHALSTERGETRSSYNAMTQQRLAECEHVVPHSREPRHFWSSLFCNGK